MYERNPDIEIERNISLVVMSFDSNVSFGWCLQVLVELDGVEWQSREWLKVHKDFSAFLVEETLVISQRAHPDKPGRRCWWPALVSYMTLP